VHGVSDWRTLGTGAWGLGEKFTPRALRAKGYEGDNPYQREHDDLMASIRGSVPYRFEGDYGAASSMTAILGRMATYSGRVVTWEEATRSELRLAPSRYAWDADPPAVPLADASYAAAVPGVSHAW
jgi:myo-inositol 2-dehydrogenase / D-chiro-inositol 1-dehydrogenase